MKKLSVWALLLAMCVTMLAGCSNNETKEPTPESTPESSSEVVVDNALVKYPREERTINKNIIVK